MPTGGNHGLSEVALRRLVGWLPGLVAGVLVGAAAASRWGAGPLASLLLGLLAALLATRVRDTLEARMREALSDEPYGAALSLAFDMAVGAGAGLAAAPLLDASVLPVVGAGAGAGGALVVPGRAPAGRNGRGPGGGLPARG